MLKRRTFHNVDCFNFHFNIDISIPKSVSESSTKGRKNERRKEGKKERSASEFIGQSRTCNLSDNERTHEIIPECLLVHFIYEGWLFGGISRSYCPIARLPDN